VLAVSEALPVLAEALGLPVMLLEPTLSGLALLPAQPASSDTEHKKPTQLAAAIDSARRFTLKHF
jgi:hypothetical protein